MRRRWPLKFFLAIFLSGTVLSAYEGSGNQKVEVNKAENFKKTGDHWAKEGEIDRALTSYRKASAFPYEMLTTEQHLEIARYFGNVGSYRDAAAELQNILKHDPDNTQALYLKALFLSWQNKYLEAEEPIDRVLQKEPENVEALLIKGSILTQTQRAKEALSLYHSLLNKNLTLEKKFEAQAGLLRALVALNYLIQAETLFAQLGPQTPQQENEKKALQSYLKREEALALRPPEPQIVIKQPNLKPWQKLRERAIAKQKPIEPKLPSAPPKSAPPKMAEPRSAMPLPKVPESKPAETLPPAFKEEKEAKPIEPKLPVQPRISEEKLRQFLVPKEPEIKYFEKPPMNPEEEKRAPLPRLEEPKIPVKPKILEPEAPLQPSQLPEPKSPEIPQPLLKKEQPLCASYKKKIAEAHRKNETGKLSLYYKNLGDCYLHDKESDEAIAAYEKAFTYPYGDLTLKARFDMAEFLGKQGNYETSMSQLKKIIEESPTFTDAYIALARFLSWIDKYEEAEKYIDQALSQAPNRREALIIKGDILNWSDHPIKALIYYHLALENKEPLSSEESFSLYTGLSWANLTLGNYSEAVKYFTKVHPELNYQKKQYDKLQAKLESLDQPHEKKTEEIAAEETPKKEGEETGEKPPKKKETNIVATGDLGMRIRLANEYTNCLYLKGALGILYGLLMYDPCDPDVHIALGRTLGIKGQYVEALMHLDYALHLNPTLADAWVIKGAVLRWKGNIPASACAFQRALELDPSSFDARIGLAWTNLARDYRVGSEELLSSLQVETFEQATDYWDVAEETLTGPLIDFRFSRYQDSDHIITDDYLVNQVTYWRDYKFNIFYSHVFATQPVGLTGTSVEEWGDEVGAWFLKMYNPTFDLGGGVGFAHTKEGNFVTGRLFSNLRTCVGRFRFDSDYALFKYTAAALFFKIRYWTNSVDYFYKINGDLALGARYFYTLWSDRNISHKVQGSYDYRLVHARCWDLFTDYNITYWNFKDQPISPFVVPGVFGGNGYFDPQGYFGNQWGLNFIRDDNRTYLQIRGHVGYATYRLDEIRYNGLYYVALAKLDYYFKPGFYIGGGIEAGTWKMKNLKYDYAVFSARLGYAF